MSQFCNFYINRAYGLWNGMNSYCCYTIKLSPLPPWRENKEFCNDESNEEENNEQFQTILD